MEREVEREREWEREGQRGRDRFAYIQPNNKRSGIMEAA